MKTLTRSLMLTILFVGATALANSMTVTEFTIGDGGSLKWNGKMGKDCKCDPNGTNCKIKITTSLAVIDDGAGLELTGSALSGEFDLTDLADPVLMESVAGVNLRGATLDIRDGDFPGIRAQRVVISTDVVLGRDGSFSVHVAYGD